MEEEGSPARAQRLANARASACVRHTCPGEAAGVEADEEGRHAEESVPGMLRLAVGLAEVRLVVVHACRNNQQATD